MLHIYSAAQRSNDGHRCMIAPSPEIREIMVKELDRLRGLTDNKVLANMLTPKQPARVGFNDGLVVPGKVFPLGTSAATVRMHSSRRNMLRGTLRVAVVLVDFPDKKFSQQNAHFEDLFFSGKKGSVRHYFKEVSNNLIDIDGEVVGPFMMPKKITTYANGASGTGDPLPNARTMASDAAKAALPEIDFGQYDNDDDGYVDAFVVIHAGSGAEQTMNPNDIWSHKWILPEVLDGDNTNIYAYLTVPEDCKLGVCVHELGHLLFGFPDLYDTDGSTAGVGDWCLMGSGSWNDGGDTPAHPCAWCKVQQGWSFVANQVKNEERVKIAPVQKGNLVYRLWKEGLQGNEYFLVENRQQSRYDRFIPASGLLIWHIDDNIDSNSNEFHYKVALMQADGRKDLESRKNNTGDEGDPFPGAEGNTVFNKNSNPSSLSYGGLDTGVQVMNISEGGEVVTADLFVSTRRPRVVRKTTRKKKEEEQ